MPNEDVTLVSTTDTAEQVAEALGAKPEEQPAETTEAKPAVTEEKPAAKADDAKPQGEATPAEPPAPKVDEPPADETPQQKAERASKSARERRMAKIQADIDDLIAQKHDARRDLEAEERELAELRAKKTALQAEIDAAAAKPAATATPAATPVVAFDRPKPKLQDTNADGSQKYADYEEWVDAVSQWHADKARAEAKAEADATIAEATKKLKDADTARETARTAQTQQQEAIAAFNAKADAFRKGHPDFDAVRVAATESVKEILDDLGPAALHAIDTYTVQDADNGPGIIYFLAQHPEEMRRIAALPLPRQLAALGKIDQRLADASPPPARPAEVPVSRAPEPITPVSSTPSASSVSPEDEDYQTWKERRNREERKRMGLPV